MKYLHGFVDVKSKFVFTVSLRKKSGSGESLKIFLQWLNGVKDVTRLKFTSDRGSEFKYGDFAEILKDRGYYHEMLPRETPRLSLMEQEFRGILGNGRTSLFSCNLPDKYWPYVFARSANVQNALPRASLDNKAPREVFEINRPTLDEFRVFGCRTYHMKTGKLKKIETRADKGINLGIDAFAASTKSYKILNERTAKVNLTRDVKFFEDNIPSVNGIDRLSTNNPGVEADEEAEEAEWTNWVQHDEEDSETEIDDVDDMKSTSGSYVDVESFNSESSSDDSDWEPVFSTRVEDYDGGYYSDMPDLVESSGEEESYTSDEEDDTDTDDDDEPKKDLSKKKDDDEDDDDDSIYDDMHDLVESSGEEDSESDEEDDDNEANEEHSNTGAKTHDSLKETIQTIVKDAQVGQGIQRSERAGRGQKAKDPNYVYSAAVKGRPDLTKQGYKTPKNFREAMKLPENKLWLEACKKEIDKL
jgi:hypothetical protein